MELTECSSDSDNCGCDAWEAQLTARNVEVRNSDKDGFCVTHRGNVVLFNCTVTDCRQNGVVALWEGHLEMDGCTYQNNGECGVSSCERAVVEARGCSSTGNMNAGYWSEFLAQMTVVNSYSDAEGEGYGVGDGGKLTVEDVTEKKISENLDGVPKPCTLP